MTRKYVSPDGFRAVLKSGGKTDNLVVMMGTDAVTKVVDDEDRSLDFVISTDALDRHGDRVSVDGWDLKNYRKCPVVLAFHDHGSLPVANARNVRIEDGKLKARAVFTPPGVARYNDTIFDMYRLGFMHAVSVGFMPKRWQWAEDGDRKLGIDFLEQELLEFSVVSVPANPEALVELRSLGIDCEPLLEQARKTLGMTDEHEIITREQHAELLAIKAERDKLAEELKRLKAKQLILPEPAKHSRLTRCALKLARLKG